MINKTLNFLMMIVLLAFNVVISLLFVTKEYGGTQEAINYSQERCAAPMPPGSKIEPYNGGWAIKKNGGYVCRISDSYRICLDYTNIVFEDSCKAKNFIILNYHN